VSSYNSFTSDTEQTNYGNQAQGIIIVKYNNKVIKLMIQYNYKNHICVQSKIKKPTITIDTTFI